MKVIGGKDINREEWSRLVQTSATGTWFQTPEAYDFFAQFGHDSSFASQPELFEPFVIGVTGNADSDDGLKNAEKLRGICVGYVTKEKSRIRQFFTRRAIINGGICCADDATNAEIERLLFSVREHLRDKTIYIETRNFNDYSRWKEAFEKAGFAYQPHLNFHVDCTDKEAMEARLSENRKRQIRKAESSKPDAESISGADVTEQDVREWYEILQKLYKTKVKTPLFPLSFFLYFYRQRLGKYLLVKHDGHVIGGVMCPIMEGRCVYEWFECGENSAYKEQYPSVMATWAGMQWAHEQGCRRYDMMGAGEPGVPYGVRDFKSEFGGETVEHGRFLYVAKPILYRIGQLGVRILKSR